MNCATCNRIADELELPIRTLCATNDCPACLAADTVCNGAGKNVPAVK